MPVRAEENKCRFDRPAGRAREGARGVCCARRSWRSSCGSSTPTCRRTTSSRTAPTISRPPWACGTSARSAGGRGQGPGLQSRASTSMAGARPHRRRDRQRRHAVPGRFGHRRAESRRAHRPSGHPSGPASAATRRASCCSLPIAGDEGAAGAARIAACRSRSTSRPRRSGWREISRRLESVLADVRARRRGLARRCAPAARRDAPSLDTAAAAADARRSPRRAIPALARRRPFHLPRLPRIRLRAARASGADLDGSAEDRPRHPARRRLLGLRRPAQLRRAAGRRCAQFCASRELLLITKSNRRATVHRAGADGRDRRSSASMPQGKSTGERLFVGLFTSAAYTRSPREIPLLRRKVDAASWRAPASPPNSHDGKALLNILETYPRDELFQIARGRPASTSPSASCTCRSASASRCSCAATRSSASSPAWSSCRATATTPSSARCAFQEILGDGLRRHGDAPTTRI